MTVSLSVDGKVTEVPDGATIEVFGARRVSVLFVMELGQERGPVAAVSLPHLPRQQTLPLPARAKKRAPLLLPPQADDPPPRVKFSVHKSQQTYDELLPVLWYVMRDREWRSFSQLTDGIEHYLTWPTDLIRQRLGWLIKRMRADGLLESRPLHAGAGPREGRFVYQQYRRPGEVAQSS